MFNINPQRVQYVTNSVDYYKYSRISLGLGSIHQSSRYGLAPIVLATAMGLTYQFIIQYQQGPEKTKIGVNKRIGLTDTVYMP